MKIILIMTDTQRLDMVSCYKDVGIKTPCIDKLAQEGIRFTKAYTTQPVCGPARSAIFTGLFPHSNGVFANNIAPSKNVKTIGERLKDDGMHTAYIGKWHLDGSDYFGLGRCDDGWDQNYWYDMRNYLEELSLKDRIRSREKSSMDGEGIKREFTYANRCSNKAIDFIKKYSDDDYFLVLSYDEPHGPSLCPEPYASMYKDFSLPKYDNLKDTLDNKPRHQQVWAGEKRFLDRENMVVNDRYLFGCNSFVDSEIGRVMEVIDEYADDALIIYTSDHGAMIESHCLDQKGPAAYEEITHIPLIMRCKGLIKSNVTHENPVSHIDIVPTVLEYTKMDVPKCLEGKSLLPIFNDESMKVNEDIFIEFGRYEIDHDGFGGFQPLRAVYDGRYKLVINLLSSDELYDLEEDPEEMINLICSKDHSEIRNCLHDKILDWQNKTRDPFRGYYWEERSWRDGFLPTWKYTGKTRQRENDRYEPRQLDYDTGLEIEETVRLK